MRAHAVELSKSAWKVGSRRLLATASLATAIGACNGCDGSSELKIAGPTPYIRCLAAHPPADGSRQIGALRIDSKDGHVRIHGLRAPLVLVAFSGPAFGEAPGERELAAIRAAAPQLVLMLGGVGDDVASASATLSALARLDLPTLILAGGRDRRDRIERALSSLPDKAAARILDVTGAIGVSIGNDMLVPVAGALEGRYALDGESCGYARSDLDSLAAKLPSGRGRRWLIAWDAPAGGGEAAVTRTEDGLDLGSAALAELARDIGANGGLFAWPQVQLLRPSAGRDHLRANIGGPAEPDLRVVVPRLTGPAMERSDGSYVSPGFAVLELGARGMRVISTHPAR